MGIASKEERVLELFINEPARHWHFSQILSAARVSRRVASRWLRRLKQDNIIIHIRPDGKMPYFKGNHDNPEYKARKRLYAMQKLYETGLIQELQRLNNAKTVIIFGSFVRTDWNSESDVDVFVYGDSGAFRYGRLWKGLGFQGRGRDVQVHTFQTKKEMESIRSGLLKNVVRGYVVKGDIYEVMKVAAS